MRVDALTSTSFGAMTSCIGRCDGAAEVRGPPKEFTSIVFILLRSASISYMYIFTGIDVCLYVWAGGALNGYENVVWSAYYTLLKKLSKSPSRQAKLGNYR